MKPAARAKQQHQHSLEHPGANGASSSPAGKRAQGDASASSHSPSSSASSSSIVNAAESILRAIQTAARGRNHADHRESTRYHYCVPMTVHIDDARKPGTRIVRAATSNISNGGFAFIFDAAVSPGSTIRAQFDSLPGKPQIAGIVRSCVHICGTQHRIGVEYQ